MPDRTEAELRRTIGTSQLFTLSFGSIVGAGWVVGVGVWLSHAGPVGTALAFTAGGLMMILVGLCYGEMTAAIPVSGGELAYAYAVFGSRACFAVGWFLALGFVVTTVFEALTSVWLIGSLLPGALGPVLYHAFGEPMRPGGLVIGLGGTVIITVLNYFGVRQAVTTQDVLTYIKIGIAVLLVACGLFAGHLSNLRPLFQYDAAGGAWRGIAAVLLTVPFWLSGFSLVAQVMEEKAPDTPARRVATMIVLSIIVSTVFYILLTLASAAVTPWPSLVSADLPVARAFEVAFGSVLLARLVLLAALLGTITVWNGCAIAASRMLFALARAHFIGASLERIDPKYRTPTAAIVFVGVATAVGVLLGRTAIGPVIGYRIVVLRRRLCGGVCGRQYDCDRLTRRWPGHFVFPAVSRQWCSPRWPRSSYLVCRFRDRGQTRVARSRSNGASLLRGPCSVWRHGWRAARDGTAYRRGRG